MPPRPNEILGLYAETIRDTGDVVEVADHLNGVVYRPVVEAVAAERVEVRSDHVPGVMGELRREGAERTVGLAELGATPVARDGVDVGIRVCLVRNLVSDLFPEVVGVRLRSVVALLLARRHGGEHLALGPGQRGLGEHDRPVEQHAVPQGERIDAHDVKNVPEPSRSLDSGIELALQDSRGLANRNLPNERH